MDNLGEMRLGVQSGLNVTANSSLFPPATIDSAINRAYQKAGGLFKWPALEDAVKTSTVATQEYYDAPTTWRPDSIFRIEIDGVQWGEAPDGSPMKYPDYLIWRANSNNANSTLKKWAVQWLRYFVFPVPTTNGANNLHIWGYENVEELTLDADTTIFSSNMPECNEAIVLETVAILKKKGEAPKTGQMLSDEAKQILIVAYNKIRGEQAKYEKAQPMFEVEDMFSSSRGQTTGNF